MSETLPRPVTAEGTTPRVPPTPSAGLLAGAATVTALVAGAVVALSTSQALALLGLPDPGAVTTYGLPAVRGVGELAAVVAVGSLLLAAFLVPPQRSGVLGVDGYRAVRAASVAATTWALCALLAVPLTLSDASGQPLSEILDPALLLPAVSQVEDAVAWLWTAGIATALALGCRLALRWFWAPLLLGVALASLLPLTINGHSSVGGNHDVATNSLVLHVLAASLWAGGLLALLVHARVGGSALDVASRRFSTLAGIAFIVVGITGVLNALVRVGFDDLLTSTYGRLVLAKVAALVVLGGFGWAQRRRAVTALALDPDNRRPLVRLGVVEALLLAATVGLAVGLGRTPPPAGARAEPSLVEEELGYDLAGPPTVTRLLLDWRFDLVFGSLALVLVALYAAGVWRLRRRGDTWASGRTLSFVLGCGVLLLATSSGVGRYSPAMFSVHMGSHMALTMLAPVLLVLGAPVTLALRALPAHRRDQPPGPREWLLVALHSWASRIITHPVVVLALFVGSFYALYLGGLFDVLVGSHVAHVAMNAHFLITGYLFYWVAIGVDPAPRSLPSLGKLALVFAALPFHAFFLVVLIGADTVVGGAFYSSLGLSWNTDLAADQRLGGSLAWAAGELPLLLVVIAVAAQWSRDDERTARRQDRAADSDGGRELAAYNAMLAGMGSPAPRGNQPLPAPSTTPDS